ncbi:MAG: hypothetical protein AAB319_01940, partial [Pseudomonadota bacterium]
SATALNAATSAGYTNLWRSVETEMKNAGWWVAAALAALILATIFVAYQQPALLLDLLNLRYCG